MLPASGPRKGITKISQQSLKQRLPARSTRARTALAGTRTRGLAIGAEVFGRNEEVERDAIQVRSEIRELWKHRTTLRPSGTCPEAGELRTVKRVRQEGATETFAPFSVSTPRVLSVLAHRLSPRRMASIPVLPSNVSQSKKVEHFRPFQFRRQQSARRSSRRSLDPPPDVLRMMMRCSVFREYQT